MFAFRAEFRRADRAGPWVLAGVTRDGRFWPALAEVEPIRHRLEPGLLGWAALPSPILAASVDAAAEAALDVARSTWPDRNRADVPFAHGVSRRETGR
jgi:hypothetical protein